MQVKKSDLYQHDGTFKGLERLAESLKPDVRYVMLFSARNRLHKWWLMKFHKIPEDYIVVGKPQLDELVKGEVGTLYGVHIDSIVDVGAANISAGKVVRATKRTEYEPNIIRTGGRVVKTMPRELRKIKEAQEKMPDDDENV